MMRVITRFSHSRSGMASPLMPRTPRAALRPRKAPSQARSWVMVDTLLAAATRVLARESLAGFNTNRVAEVAGVSVGSLYQYFPNKAALVVALIDREQAKLAQALEEVVHANAGHSLADGLRALACLAIDQQYRDPVFAAALDHEERRLPIGTQLRQHEQRLGAAVLAFLQQHAQELPPDRVSPVVARDLLLIARALVEADAQEARKAPPDLSERLLRALSGYLGVGQRR